MTWFRSMHTNLNNVIEGVGCNGLPHLLIDPTAETPLGCKALLKLCTSDGCRQEKLGFDIKRLYIFNWQTNVLSHINNTEIDNTLL